MNSGIFGLPGSGKTTVLTWCALRALAGKPLYIGHLWGKIPLQEFDSRSYENVFTTFPVPGCARFDYEDTVGTFQYKRCLILIDEMSLYQDNRDFKTYTKEKKLFFATLRHTESDLIYCSQDWRDVDKKIQNMTHNLFLVEGRSRHRSRISPILPEQACKLGDIKTVYSLAPRISRTTLHRKSLYSSFDSFQLYGKPLPPVPVHPWYPETETEPELPPLAPWIPRALSLPAE